MHFIAILKTFLPSYLFSEPPQPLFSLRHNHDVFSDKHTTVAFTCQYFVHYWYQLTSTIAIAFFLRATIIKVVTIQLHKQTVKMKDHTQSKRWLDLFLVFVTRNMIHTHDLIFF